MDIRSIRREEAAFGQQDGDIDLVMSFYLSELLGDLIVVLLSQGIEFLLIGDGNDGNSALVLERDHRVAHDVSLDETEMPKKTDDVEDTNDQNEKDKSSRPTPRRRR